MLNAGQLLNVAIAHSARKQFQYYRQHKKLSEHNKRIAQHISNTAGNNYLEKEVEINYLKDQEYTGIFDKMQDAKDKSKDQSYQQGC